MHNSQDREEHYNQGLQKKNCEILSFIDVLNRLLSVASLSIAYKIPTFIFARYRFDMPKIVTIESKNKNHRNKFSKKTLSKTGKIKLNKFLVVI